MLRKMFSLIAAAAFFFTASPPAGAQYRPTTGTTYGPGTGSNPASTYVHGYTRSNGTYVNGYQRSVNDGRFENNWSTKPNVNPVTGMRGTKITPPQR